MQQNSTFIPNLIQSLVTFSSKAAQQRKLVPGSHNEVEIQIIEGARCTFDPHNFQDRFAILLAHLE